MTTRERMLAILLFGLILLAGGGAAGYMLVWEPIQQKNAAAAKLEQEVDELQFKMLKQAKDAPRLAQARLRSLPADENLARREYTEMMSRLLRQANVPPGFKITEKAVNDQKTIPLLPGAAKKPAYTKVVYEIDFANKVDMLAVSDFLVGYYRLNLLHQITAISIRRDDSQVGGSGNRNRPAGDRKNLAVKLTTEAILLDGAEPRRTLLPVPNGFAAVGGLAGYNALALTPEAGRGLSPTQFAPVLSTRNRDYTFLVVKDIFNGPLPPPSPLRLDKIADVVAEPEKSIPPVKIPVGGDLAYFGQVTLTATAEGALLPPGAVKVDQKAHTLSLTPLAGETGTATVTVVAKSESGQQAKTTFKLSVKEPSDSTEVKKEDISAAIRLVAVATRSDGTALAVIRDDFNPHTYEITVNPPDSIVVRKFFFVPKKKEDRFYDDKKLLIISDDTSATRRTFRVVAIDDTGLVLADLKPAEAKPKPAPKAPAPGRGAPRGPVGKGRTPEGPASPLAVVVGLAAAGDEKPVPALYRWDVGRPLTALTEVSKDQARKILEKAAQTGPVGATAVAASRP